MTLLALIAMICGPVSTSDLIKRNQATSCYKDLLLCIERKQAFRPKPSDEAALKACVLEM